MCSAVLRKHGQLLRQTGPAQVLYQPGANRRIFERRSPSLPVRSGEISFYSHDLSS